MYPMEYKAIEEILSRLHRVSPDEAKAFKSRLRILRDAGVPNVARPGKGARVSYSREDLFMAHLGLTLDAAGFPPLVLQSIATEFSEQRFYTQIESSPAKNGDQWLKLNIIRRVFGGEGSGEAAIDLGALDEHFKSLRNIPRGQKPPGGFQNNSAPAFHGLLNVTELYDDIRREAERYGE